MHSIEFESNRRPAREALLTVQNLTIDLVREPPQRAVVQDVSFSVPRGGSLALIGESGCGKTLTARSLLGLLPPAARLTSGTALFDGVDLYAATRRQLTRIRGSEIGAVFQDPMTSLDPTMTIGDHVAEPRRLHLGESGRQARRAALDLLKRVEIPRAAERMRAYPHELSGGMQQRVMIAAAIACDCRLLIADEPTTALDVTIQSEVLALLRQLQSQSGMSVLLVTHDLGVVADFCDEVVTMYAGHVVERGAVDGLFGSPQHPYTAALLQAVPHPDRALSTLATIPGRVPPAGEMPSGCRFAPRCDYSTQRCQQPQQEAQARPEHFTKCGRVSDGELDLVSAS